MSEETWIVTRVYVHGFAYPDNGIGKVSTEVEMNPATGKCRAHSDPKKRILVKMPVADDARVMVGCPRYNRVEEDDTRIVILGETYSVHIR